MKFGQAIYHTVLDSQRDTFTNHVNQVLRTDKDIGKKLPIIPKDIFEVVGDGIILCKLINSAVNSQVPPISPAAINLNPISVYHRIQNLNLAIESAKAIGCTVVNIHASLIMQKRQHIILGLIWQIIRIYLSSKITLKNHPELILLKKPDQQDSVMQKLGYQQILIRWINYHIKKNGGNKQIKNLGADMIDGYAYGQVLTSVAPSLPKNYFNLSNEERAVQIIKTCERQGLRPPANAQGILSGNVRVNTLLCAQIFNNRHGLIIQKEKIVQLPPEPQTDQSRQMRVFKNWINSQGIQDIFVNHLIQDLKSGKILLKVIQRLRPGIVDWKKYSPKQTSRIHIVQNCNYVIDICKDQLHTKVIGIGGVDIVDGKVSLTLGVVWQLCKLYWQERVGQIPEQKLVAWANQRVPQQIRIKNFKDKSIKNCQFLLKLIESVRPNTVDFSKVPSGQSEDEVNQRINYTISMARKLGCEIIALWQHVKQANAKYIGLFVAQLQFNLKKHPQ